MASSPADTARYAPHQAVIAASAAPVVPASPLPTTNPSPGQVLFGPVTAPLGRTSSYIHRRPDEQRMQVVLDLAVVARGANPVPAHQRRQTAFDPAAMCPLPLLEVVGELSFARGLRFLILRPEAQGAAFFLAGATAGAQ